jgi:NTE family protein
MTMNVGLVLSGGGARGIAHLGIVKALLERGIAPTVISGTSSGALVGSLLANGYTPDEALELFLSNRLFRKLRPGWGGPGLLRIDGLAVLLKEFLPENSFEKLKIPLIVNATDVNSGEAIYFSEGELVPVLLASCCIPGVFKPYSLLGRSLVDGGVLDNLPVSPVEPLVDYIVGSHCNPFELSKPVQTTREVVARSFILAAHGKTREKFSRCQLLLEPPLLRHYAVYDFWKAAEIFQVGYDYTLNLLKERDGTN